MELMGKPYFRKILLGVLAGFWAKPIFACGICMYAATEYILPGSIFWFALGCVCLIYSSWILRSVEEKVNPFFGPREGIILFFLALGSLVVVGPIVGILGLVWSLAGVCWMAKPEVRKKVGDRVWNRLKIGYKNCLVILAMLVIFSGYSWMTRTPADYILRWDRTGFGRAVFNALLEKNPPRVDQLEILVKSGSGKTACVAAKQLMELGETVTLEQIEGAIKRTKSIWQRDELEALLDELKAKPK